MKGKMLFDGSLGPAVTTPEQATAEFRARIDGVREHVSDQQLAYANKSWELSLDLSATKSGNIIVAVGDDSGFCACEFPRAIFHKMFSDIKEEMEGANLDDLNGAAAYAVRLYIKERMNEPAGVHALDAPSINHLLSLANMLYELHRRSSVKDDMDPERFSDLDGAGLILFAHVAKAKMDKVSCMIFTSRWHVPMKIDQAKISDPATFHGDKMGNA